MSKMRLVTILAAALTLAPLAAADGLIPVSPLVNGDFDTYVVAGVSPAARPALDRCVGIGHQAYDPLYSAWGAFVLGEVAADPAGASQEPGFAERATGYPAAHAGMIAGNPDYAHRCDPHYREITMVNAWEKTRDTGFGWSNDPGTKFYDADSDGDVEAIIPRVHQAHNHNLWQSTATPTQAFSADFDAFTFRVESGAIRTSANIQIGLALSPSYMQHPFVGAFWEGAVLFRANDMVLGADGLVSLDPAAQGEITCPAYAPCREFQAEFNAADAAGKRTLLGQARVVQTSFWAFSGGLGPVVIDDVAYVGAKSAAETPPRVNPGV